MKKNFEHHVLLHKYYSRLITTKLLISLCNIQFYIPFIPGVNLGDNSILRFEQHPIKARLILKTLYRETKQHGKIK